MTGSPLPPAAGAPQPKRSARRPGAQRYRSRRTSLKNVKPFTLSRLLRPRDRSRSENMRGGYAGSLSWAVTIQLETTLALTPAQEFLPFAETSSAAPGRGRSFRAPRLTSPSGDSSKRGRRRGCTAAKTERAPSRRAAVPKSKDVLEECEALHAVAAAATEGPVALREHAWRLRGFPLLGGNDSVGDDARSHPGPGVSTFRRDFVRSRGGGRSS
jgi:hypothetical protein